MRESIEKIVSGIRTKEERDLMLAGLRIVENSIFQKSAEHLFRELAQAGIPGHNSRQLIEMAEEKSVKDHGQRSDFFAALKKTLEELPVFRLEISFEPREKTMDKLKSWAEREIGKDIIFDLILDRSILGGTKLSFRGRYREYTFESLISSVLSLKREEITKLIS